MKGHNRSDRKTSKSAAAVLKDTARMKTGSVSKQASAMAEKNTSFLKSCTDAQLAGAVRKAADDLKSAADLQKAAELKAFESKNLAAKLFMNRAEAEQYLEELCEANAAKEMQAHAARMADIKAFNRRDAVA